MISLARPLPSGNAVRLWLTPPAGAQWWRVLRRSSGAISGPTDPGAAVIEQQTTDECLLDIDGLENGTLYTYRGFAWNGSAWIEGAPITATPEATYAGDAVSPQNLVRERLELGLKVEVARGNLKPKTGRIQVLTAPAALSDQTSFPAVSVHFENSAPENRALGETIVTEEHASPAWIDREGWHESVTLSIVGVANNGDERIALREAIQRVILANLSVFASSGMMLPSLKLRDSERLGEDGAELYYVNGTFDFVASAFVSSEDPEVSDVIVEPTFEEPVLHGQA